jgi:hypothetical protein
MCERRELRRRSRNNDSGWLERAVQLGRIDFAEHNGSRVGKHGCRKPISGRSASHRCIWRRE